MSEQVNTQTGEVIETAALVPLDGLRAMVKDQDQATFSVVEKLETLNWRDMRPPHMALLLMQKPFPVSGGGSLFLNFRQAIFFATRCYELGVSPFSSEVWFDPAKFSVNLTLEGKRQVARNKGIDLGPPQFEDIERPWDKVPKMTDLVKELQKQGFTKDIGIKCKIRVGDVKNAEFSQYICWLSEWAVIKSPVWQAKPLHMLQIRATEKCISLAMGTGASEMVGNEVD
jgi:hypothetical protein